jgi:hypothetical protein
MTDKTEKPDLKIVKKETDLTMKQRAFVEEIIKGKLGSHIDAYMKIYDVALTKSGKTPKHAHVDCSVLMSNPKIALAIRKGMDRKETSAVASSLRTRSYVLERLMKESKEADSDSARISALSLLGKTVNLFSDTIEIKEARDSNDIEADIEAKIVALLSEQEVEQ